MVRSTGTIVSVRIPINWDYMTQRQQTRLNRITSRDTRVIKAYLGVIERHKNVLVIGDKYKRVDIVQLDRLTLTALRARNPSKRRVNVPHDFKTRFRNISVNELQECRDVAVSMWNSYLERGGSPPLKSNNGRSKKIPRNIFTLRFNLVHRPDLKVKHWIELRDSLDSARQGRTRHDKLTIPLKMSPFHTNEIGRGEIKSCRILKDRSKRWWATFAVKVGIKAQILSGKKPMAVMGVDLGISNAACAVVITQEGVHHVQYFHQQGKERSLSKYERRVASLQREMRIRQNTGKPSDKITRKLRELNQKRAPVREEWDRVLAREILNYAIELTSKYNLYVAVGNPKGIRNIATRQYSRGRKYRGMIHRWAFQRIISSIEHGFSQLGWTTGRIGSRFLAVYEGRTSITCSMCGQRGIRPKQSLFVCHTCGHRTNADKNGAINIARRMIRLTPDLRDEHKGLGRWIYSIRKKPSSKAARGSKHASKRKSKLSKRSLASYDGESAVVRFVQMNLCSSGDGAVMSDEDPAVEKAAETSSVTRHLDSPRTGESGLKEQRTEASFRHRSHTPMKSDNTRATLKRLGGSEVSDDSHELGRTQKLQAEYEFHSPVRRDERAP
ncbi:MAG: zinc ribbon domain-containing protein [Candidatus Thorarchaeota archaeon]